MISGPRPTSIAGGSGDGASPVEWQELDVTTMLENESKLQATSTVATNGSEWESSLERSEYAVVLETIFATMLAVVSVIANGVIVIMTEWR